MMMKYFSLVLLSLIALPVAYAARFVNQPAAFNATLGQQVRFSCSISGSGTIFWLVNEEDIFADSNANRRITVSSRGLESTLNIIATAMNNNTVIKCGLRYQGSYAYTQGVDLKVQGLLSAPTDVNAYAINNTIHVTWSAPPTLNLTNIDPDISNYQVTTHNTHTGHQTTTTVVSTEYVHRLDMELCGTELCVEVIEFRVSAVNSVGTGNMSECISSLFHEAPTLTNNLNTGFELEQLQVLTAGDTVLFKCTASCEDTIAWDIVPQDKHHGKFGVASNYFSLSFECNSTTNELNYSIEFIADLEMSGASVQCVGVSQYCSGENHGCRPSACFSETIVLPVVLTNETSNTVSLQLQSTIVTDIDGSTIRNNSGIVSSYIPPPTDGIKKSTVMENTIIVGIGVAFGVLTLTLILIIAILMIVMATMYKRMSKKCKLKQTKTCTSTQVVHSEVTAHFQEEESGSDYSIPLPTDPCVAYETVEQAKARVQQL